MPIRITGMNSGLDTESIITELVKAKSEKKNTLVKAQTKLSYKQEAWKSLNTKVYSLYSKTISNLTFTTAYKKKTTKVSDDAKASVITGADATNGVQKLTVSSLAASGYLTGEELSKNKAYTSSTKLCEITGTYSVGETESMSFSVTTGGTTTAISLTGASTIGDVVSQLKEAGVNANFDEKNQRLFVSAKETGKDADFAITADNQGGSKALSVLGINVLDSTTLAQYTKYANLTDTEKQALIDEEVQKRVDSANAKLTAAEESITAANTAISEQQNAINDFLSTTQELAAYVDAQGAMDTTALETAYTEWTTRKETLQTVPENETEAEKALREEELGKIESNIAAYNSYKAMETNLQKAQTDLSDAQTSKTEAEDLLMSDAQAIKNAVTAETDSRIAYAKSVANGTAGGYSAGATRVIGQDAEITLNDATFTSKTNNFEINGLTITVKNTTAAGESITLTTSDDYDAIYDTIKNFLSEYNKLINEMDSLYNAESASDYEPLTDDEKDSMSDSEVEKWEQKIKDSILRKDSTLYEISSLLTSAMSAGYEVNGKTMYLSHFGIGTLGYFTAADNEKHAYHIDGDPDDENTAGNSDVLKTMIANEPETVISFFTQLCKSMYSSLGEKMKSNDYSGYNKVYNDKQMESEYKSYTEKIEAQEKIITAAEDKYYEKFSAMETALAKLESKSNAVSSILGY